MKNTFPIISSKSSSTVIHIVSEKEYKSWLGKQPASEKKWLAAQNFKPVAGNFALLPGKAGDIRAVICIIESTPTVWSIAHLPEKLPLQTYKLETRFKGKETTQMALGWALGCYQFTRYKKSSASYATLQAPKGCNLSYIKAMYGAITWARDLINTPANDMTPAALAKEASDWAKKAGGTVKILKGQELLKQNYPLVYNVGKASNVPPHLVDIRFARKGARKVTLVGKGVCFDSGGLDIKSTDGMRLMKKDMGGAACVLALAKALVETKVPVQLRVLLPIVENSISGNAMRPLDIIKSRKGITVEIGNTDAEGRLILCDALYEADSEKPDLLIDCATLTGAARVALGGDVPAFFTPDDKLAANIEKFSENNADFMWRLPLYKPYRAMMDSSIADINNDAASGYGGTITAALYLQEFVSNTHSWVHIDMMAWNLVGRPGRPRGGEAMAVRALYGLIRTQYGK